MAATYGAAVLGTIDYETYLGLWLNKDRAMVRQAACTTMGVNFALSEKLPAVWFECMTDDQADAVIASAKHEADMRRRSVNKVYATQKIR